LVLLHCAILCNFITFVSSSEIPFLVLLSLLYKRLKSTKKQNFTTSSFIASLCIMGWRWECGLGLGLGLEWSGLVNITALLEWKYRLIVLLSVCGE